MRYELKDGLPKPATHPDKGQVLKRLTRRQMRKPVYEPLDEIRRRRFWHRVVLYSFGALLLLSEALLLESLRYPAPVRRDYWRQPTLMVRAFWACLSSTGGVSSADVEAHAQRLERFRLRVHLLYLPDIPPGRDSIRQRVFRMIMDDETDSTEDLFWLAVPHAPHQTRYWALMDDAILYEYRTGRIVAIKGGKEVDMRAPRLSGRTEPTEGEGEQ